MKEIKSMQGGSVFEIKHKDIGGRVGILKINHKKVETPALMPVVNPHKMTIEPKKFRRFGTNILITNAYILYKDFRNKVKDIHKFLNFDGVVVTDSGAFQLMRYGKIDVTNKEIVEFQKEIGSDIGTFLDIPTTPDKTHNEALRDLERTMRRAREALKITPNLNGPIQGGRFLDLRKIASIQMSKLPFLIYPVGGIVPLMEEYRFHELFEIILTCRENVPLNKPLHAFGAGHPMLFSFLAAIGVDLFDSAMYSLAAQENRYLTSHGTYSLEELREFPCSCKVCTIHTPESLLSLNEEKRIKLLAEHNLHISFEELRRVRNAIYNGELWELIQIRARSHPKLLEALKAFKKPFLERLDPVTKRKALFYSGKESLFRTELESFRIRLYRNYVPEKTTRLVILPYSERPFSKFYNVWNTESTHFAVATPFATVPLELENIYPVSQHIFTDDSILQEETLQRIREFIHHFKGRYSRIRVFKKVEAALEFCHSLKEMERDILSDIKGIVNFQFGYPAGLALENVEVRRSKRTGKIKEVYSDSKLFGTFRKDGFLIPTMWGAGEMKKLLRSPKRRVILMDEAVPFVEMGKSVFAKFVRNCDSEIRPGEEVLIVDRKDRLVAVGKAILSSREMMEMESGVAVEVRHSLK